MKKAERKTNKAMTNLGYGRLGDFMDNVKAFHQWEAFSFVFTIADNQVRVIELNTDEQLYEGIDSTGVQLSEIGGEYTEFTKAQKASEGLPTEWVTLFQTGDFYDSFRVNVQRDGFEIEANTIKERQDLQDRWGDDILGLTDDSLTEIAAYIAQDLINRILHELLR